MAADETTRFRGRWWTALRASFFLAYLLFAAAIALGTGVAGALRCDDSCIAPAYVQDWSNTSDAWQWEALSGLGTAGLICAALVVLATPLSRRLARGVFAAHCFAAVALIYVDSTGSSMFPIGRNQLLVLLTCCVFCAAGWALVTSRPRSPATFARDRRRAGGSPSRS
jgi:hypothetical protein